MQKFGIKQKRLILKSAVVATSLYAIDFTRDLLVGVFRYKLFGLASVSAVFGALALLYLLGQYKNWW